MCLVFHNKLFYNNCAILARLRKVTWLAIEYHAILLQRKSFPLVADYTPNGLHVVTQDFKEKMHLPFEEKVRTLGQQEEKNYPGI